jgi:hypothetical protein
MLIEKPFGKTELLAAVRHQLDGPPRADGDG